MYPGSLQEKANFPLTEAIGYKQLESTPKYGFVLNEKEDREMAPSRQCLGFANLRPKMANMVAHASSPSVEDAAVEGSLSWWSAHYAKTM